MRALPFVLAAALLATAAPFAEGLSLGISTPLASVTVGGQFVVGYKEGERDNALLTITLSGGEVTKVDEALRIAVAKTDRAELFTLTLGRSPHVEYVERDSIAHAAAAEWNGAQWNGAEWNAAEWNGAEWNGAQWNSQSTTNRNDPGRAWQWGVDAVRAPSAWQVSEGARGAKLCVVDSGVAWDHPDLVANAWTAPDGSHGFDVVGGTTDAYDRAGHGTHVAGIAAAAVGNGFGIAGMGNVQIMAARVLGDDGSGSESDVAIGIARCADHGADVVLLALSGEPTRTLDRAIAYATARDVLLVASAGNDGGAVAYPASDARVVAVSAVGTDKRLAGFSNRGADIEIAAPGVGILGTLPRDAYGYGSGTSQAAAFVAGTAALVRDAAPELTAQQARAALTSGAADIGAPGRDTSYGHGMLDVRASLEIARS